MSPQERVLLPLDVPSEEEALRLAEETKWGVGGFKIGLELVNAAGFDIFRKLQGQTLFYDAKLHDIPNTVAGAMRSAVKLGIAFITLHASGGRAMMEAARQATEEASRALGVERPRLLGVTVLTSLDEAALREELGVPRSVEGQVVHLARLSQASGMDGVIASPHEIQAVRQACGPDFLIVTPGIRPAWSQSGDQKRFMTPAEALRLGADYLVIGRAITAAEDRSAALKRLLEEVRKI
ncbi:MAG: orotidine-5'-phosphate decarboxylase [Armatimonadetes bacterium]|nr:orotidine-5'-phosphate decarboxylase [Armatimonadota bacterium]